MKYLSKIKEAESNKDLIKKTLLKFKKEKNKKIDQLFENLHEKVFQKIDCLQCANCCKTTSPIFRDIDIKRIAKRLKISESKFIDANLHLDEDGDYVLNQSPCLFLMDDNYCAIYEDRPLACREYPHTNRKNMYQIMDLTIKNTEICPAVADIVNKIIVTEKK